MGRTAELWCGGGQRRSVDPSRNHVGCRSRGSACRGPRGSAAALRRDRRRRGPDSARKSVLEVGGHQPPLPDGPGMVVLLYDRPPDASRHGSPSLIDHAHVGIAGNRTRVHIGGIPSLADPVAYSVKYFVDLARLAEDVRVEVRQTMEQIADAVSTVPEANPFWASMDDSV